MRLANGCLARGSHPAALLLPIAVLIVLAVTQVCAVDPLVPWADVVTAEPIPSLTDEFDGPLDLTKWSLHGIENPDTGCPRWNGPPSTSHPDYSVYFATSTDPATGASNSVLTHGVENGDLVLSMRRETPDFFTAREYYCNSTTYKCNHDDSIDCFPTKFNGEPAYKNGVPGTYWGVIHDKCKIEPYCIPSPQHVTRKQPVYKSIVGPHIASRETMRYGFVEAEVEVPDTTAVLAVWMHSDQYVNGYCRYKKGPNDRWNKHECPSAIRARRWGEIDILEAINSEKLKNKYVPNVHFFSDHKGEFSAANANANEDGLMGGGPIVMLKNEFNLANPSFGDVPTADRVANDFHYNPGSVADVVPEWKTQRRVVGMYWSPQEIRWYLDGVEVRRVANHLVHIPMHIDLSMSFNVNWAGETPTEVPAHVGKIGYVRAWNILSDDGNEVPFVQQWLDPAMVTKFDNRYGSGLNDVFTRFPQMDSYTVTPLDQAVRLVDLANATTPLGATASRLINGVEEPTTVDADADGGSGDLAQSATGRQGAAARRRRRRRNGKVRKQAGGPGNRKKLRRRRRRSRRARNILLANPQRVARQVRAGVEPLTIADPERTALDDVNPNNVAAGWATDGGEGKDDNLA